ncbi:MULTISPECIES: MFS transporter [unclassified Rhodococcus (in: high G+C Gram-positive bacteria)]|uniref:MFS transporter n=1 Tax=unclassified Rhodococcus (in: high G+C Gram-positive bacteria) TaxID=192944 RepID=UPI00163A5716|nr:MULTISPECIES: MFS transporter [unclassified Rhodococcus (in: high G+C Gram-positive bacteria)]MBC2637635.1 MFS transporter [Rhodococcus sp. 3A]MBC2897621.1 MFS transporter [Rhodococcus sp. 4CII]
MSHNDELVDGKPNTADAVYARLADIVDDIGIKSVHYKILGLIALGGLFNIIEQYNIGFAAPGIVAEWGISTSQVGFLSTATFLAMAVSSLVCGRLADRYGRKRIFMANILIYSVGALFCALAPSYESLLVARVVVGVGLGGEMALGYTVVAELMPTKRRGAATGAMSLTHGGVGIFAAAGLAALILGPLGDAVGGEVESWRILLGIMVVPALLAVLVRMYVPESPRYLIRAGKYAELNRTLTLISQNRLRANESLAIVRYFDSTEGKGVSEEKSSVAELFHRSVRRRTFVSWALVTSLFGAVTVSTIFMPTVLTSLGFDSGSSARLATLINLGGLLGGVIGVVGAHRLPRRAVGFACTLVNIVLALAIALTSSAWMALVCAFFLAFTLQVLSGTFWTYLPELYPTRIRALGSGTAITVGLVVGSALGPVISGYVYDGVGKAGTFGLVAVLCVLFAFGVSAGPETYNRRLVEG